MQNIKFWKVQSVGNDFVLIHHSSNLDFPKIAQDSCRRRISVGADGLLVVSKLESTSDDVPRIILRMFNPDGSEDFCGNGMRCAVLHAHQMGWISGHCIIEHHGTLVPASIDENGFVSTSSQAPSYDAVDVPLTRGTAPILFEKLVVSGYEVEVTAVSTGSTHSVIFCDELPDHNEFFAIGPALENDPIFPERTSVIWAQQLDHEHLRIRIWERGAGETLGCGTGSMAAAAVYFRRRESGGRMVVSNPGGDVIVKMDSPTSIIQSSALATEVYVGSLAPAFAEKSCR